ncbi:MAG: DNA-binding protein [Ignavibacteria bacterium CG22_combo_CG10-13_8_21_14_all_37_15]|nr:MAG: DNA-binding protein [Ignavibacteria bacterium CG22_combo_CG10-13_8_21_14_all_37_15]PJC58259.1 MAG: DNA-binding protein [Ignavibacteria bacterium CG_4_9_14_0_2_um_filter_37_13]
MEFLGDKEILNNYKIGFLCSRKVPSNIILKTYDWAIEQREKGVCIVSGFHSKIEKDVFHFLLKGTQPIILVLARSLKKRWEPELADAIQKNRILIISPFTEKVKRSSQRTALIRNKIIKELSDELKIAYVDPGGELKSILGKS